MVGGRTGEPGGGMRAGDPAGIGRAGDPAGACDAADGGGGVPVRNASALDGAFAPYEGDAPRYGVGPTLITEPGGIDGRPAPGGIDGRGAC